jgi:hypothetical protein
MAWLMLCPALPVPLSACEKASFRMSMFARYYIPFLNTAFVFSFLVTALLTLAVIPYGKRRPAGKSLSWGEAMVASVYVFFVLFLAYGVVPHQLLTHMGNELGWRKDKLVFGPGDILKPKSLGGFFPFQVSYEAIQDALVAGVYVVFLGIQMYMWVWWQNRHKPKADKSLVVSHFGRPLLKRG